MSGSEFPLYGTTYDAPRNRHSHSIIFGRSGSGTVECVFDEINTLHSRLTWIPARARRAPGGGDCDETSSRHHGYVSFYLHVERGASKSTGSETYFRPVQARGLSRLRSLGGCLGTQALFLRP